MNRLGVRNIVFWLFLLGIILIVFLQVISGNNINRLIEGNKSLLSELQYQNNIRKMEVDVISIESDIRGAVITENIPLLKKARERLAAIEREIGFLHNPSGERSTSGIRQLDFLIKEKMRFSNNILNSYYAYGKDAAEKVINTNRGLAISDSIITLISNLDSARKIELSHISGSIENTGKRARIWGFILSGVALLAVIIAFQFMLNQGIEQTKMIHALNASEKKIKKQQW